MIKFFRRLSATTAIAIRGSKAACLKGNVPLSAREDLVNIVESANIPAVEIWLDAKSQVTCSRRVPEHVLQRFRNILASQY